MLTASPLTATCPNIQQPPSSKKEETHVGDPIVIPVDILGEHINIEGPPAPGFLRRLLTGSLTTYEKNRLEGTVKLTCSISLACLSIFTLAYPTAGASNTSNSSTTNSTFNPIAAEGAALKTFAAVAGIISAVYGSYSGLTIVLCAPPQHN